MSPARAHLARRPGGPGRAARAALAALVAGLLAGCPGTTGDGAFACALDVECEPDQVCARDGACADPAGVREVVTRWTVRGQPASAASCASVGPLAISYLGASSSDVIGFAPVPCATGQFTIDKLPRRFDQVELGPDTGGGVRAVIPASDVVTIDLP